MLLMYFRFACSRDIFRCNQLLYGTSSFWKYSRSLSKELDLLLILNSGLPNVPGPLFLLANGQPLSRTILTDQLGQIFSTAVIEGNFSSHSFRIGGAMVAAHNSVPNHLIQALERWTSNAYQLYIRTPAEALAGISSQLA